MREEGRQKSRGKPYRPRTDGGKITRWPDVLLPKTVTRFLGFPPMFFYQDDSESDLAH